MATKVKGIDKIRELVNTISTYGLYLQAILAGIAAIQNVLNKEGNE